jgi:hypothetical protein
MKQIRLKEAVYALVDDDDFDRVNQYRWYVGYKGYVLGLIGGKWIRLHRFIMQPSEGMVVDHINHDKFDNRRSNLRVCTTTQNSQNARKSTSRRTSRFKGVSRWEKRRKFRAMIQVDGKAITLGFFEKEEDAARAYNEAAAAHYGDFAHLNQLPEANSVQTITGGIA